MPIEIIITFPLKDIKSIIDSPDFDSSKALEQQIEILRLKKEHIENLMNFALGIKLLGVKHMDFKASADAQNLVKRIQEYITDNFYTCTNKILRGLGKMYSGGGDFTMNIDSYGGEGTAIFIANAIESYCNKAE